MAGGLHSLEHALKAFLIDSQSDHYNAGSVNVAKYNNLKIYMEPLENKIPHVSIRLGISEATYSLDTVERLSGGLGGDERLVRRWLERSLVKSDLNNLWQESKKFKPVVMKEDSDD